MTRQDVRVVITAIIVVCAVGLTLGYAVGLQDIATTDGIVVPGYTDVYVNDNAEILNDGAEARIRDVLIGLYDRTGIEMTVLTIDTVRQYGHPGPIEPFATAVFNTWGIGDSATNNGVLILVAKSDRWLTKRFCQLFVKMTIRPVSRPVLMKPSEK